MRQSFAFPTLDNLVDLACRDGVDIRPTLLRVLTDLYVQKPTHTVEEEVQYVELALRLIETVDAATRETVAARLATYPAVPAAIRRKLAETATAPAPAPPAAPEPATSPGRELSDLFFAATAEERRLILINLDVVVGPLTRKPVSVAGDVLTRLETAAMQRNPVDFSRTLERALGIDRGLAERIAGDRTGEPVVVATKALGMRAAMLQRILLLLNPRIGQSVERVYDLALLFDEISLAAAEQMVTIWRQSATRPQPRHAPVYAEDARMGARTLTSPLPRRTARRDAPQPVRIRSNDG
jgi:hypothetical protein